ncbi:MAG: hypothetical protein R2798_03450 [Chitinophagales bacterium]|nr:hypothetical protein [Bacteroidota bacterium]MCB9043544.1 hypothetical protein [Chitinophagales bacterium]
MQNLMAKTWNYAALTSISCLIFGLFAFSQLTNFTLIKTVPVEGQFLTSDFLQNAYVVNTQNQLLRYDSMGNPMGKYSNPELGKLSFVDATSPFNILLMYRDKNTVMMLDNTLTVKQMYKFTSIQGIGKVSVSCLSSDNFVWFFDQDAQKLKKINKTYEIIQESLDLGSLLGEKIEPNFLIERDGFVFMNVPEMGVMTFDKYGNYYNSLPLPTLERFQIINNKLVYFADGILNILDLGRDLSLKSIEIPEADKLQQVELGSSRLFLLDKSELQVFATNL